MKELLSPAGSFEALEAAIYGGADAVYLGGKKFGARKFASNFDDQEMIKAIDLVHLYNKKIYVTINTLIYEDELEECLKYIEFLHRNNVDAIIMQDLGLMKIAHEMFPNLVIHASTQAHSYNVENIKFLESLNVKRVILARETSLDEINSFKTNMDLEIFIHGALCVSYSGCCLFSSLNGSRSGNRGECTGSCRLPYTITDGKKDIKTDGFYLLSMKDLYTAPYFDQILNSKVVSLKIEGRMKSKEYVYFVTKFYRNLIDNYYKYKKIIIDENELKILKVLYNREFTKGFLFNENNFDIANIKSSNHLGVKIGDVIDINEKIKIKLTDDLNQEDGIRFLANNSGLIVNFLYNENGKLINSAKKGDIVFVDNKVNLKEKSIVLKTIDKKLMSNFVKITKPKVKINILIKAFKNNNLEVTINDEYISLTKKYNLVEASIKHPISKENIINQFNRFGNTIYMANIEVLMDDNIFIPLKYLNEVRRDIIETFNAKKIEKKEIIKNNIKNNYKNFHLNKKTINVLVRNEEQLKACLDFNVNIYVTDYLLYKKYKSQNVYLRLERVMKNYPDFKDENLVISETGSIKYAKNNNCIGDYYLNICNNESINLLHSLGIKKVTLSVELDEEKIKKLSLNKFNLEIIVYGRLELMITKYCLLNKIINKDKICNVCKNNYYLKDRNKIYPIITKNCINHIMHYKNIDLIDKINCFKEIDNFRIELFDETKEETINLIKKVEKKLYE